jgi:prevent-host-death family protein
MFVLSTNQKGGIAETAITAAAYALDIPVLRPVVEHARYDLAFEIADKILRVQCKWGGLHEDGAVIRVNLTSSWCTPTGYERRYYTEDEIDLVAVYCSELGRCYLLPSTLVAGRRGIQLRVTPPKNGQRACLNRAVDFEFPGAIAQLEERLRGTQEAAGSSPASSTPRPPETVHVGAHEFRQHFGYYLERAADGHEVLVSRRGRPYVRLIPVEPRLQLVAA